MSLGKHEHSGWNTLIPVILAFPHALSPTLVNYRKGGVVLPGPSLPELQILSSPWFFSSDPVRDIRMEG